MLTIKILDAAENALDNFFTLVERTREVVIYEHKRSVKETKENTFDKLKEILNPTNLHQAILNNFFSVKNVSDFIVAELIEDGDIDYNSMPDASHSEDTKEEDKIDRVLSIRDVVSKAKVFFFVTQKDLALLSSGGSNIKPGDILILKNPIVTEYEFNKSGYFNAYFSCSGGPRITCIKIEADNEGKGEGDQEQGEEQGEGDQEHGDEQGEGEKEQQKEGEQQHDPDISSEEMEIYSPGDTDDDEDEDEETERVEAETHVKGEEVDISLEELQLEGTMETERDMKLRRGKIITKRVESEIKMDNLAEQGNFKGAEEERENIEKLRAQQSVLEAEINALRLKESMLEAEINATRVKQFVVEAESNANNDDLDNKIIQKDEDRPKRKSQKDKKMEEKEKLRAFLSVDNDSNHGLEVGNFGEEKGRGIKVITNQLGFFN